MQRAVYRTTLYGHDYLFSLLEHDKRDGSLTLKLDVGSGSHQKAAKRLGAQATDWFSRSGIDYQYLNRMSKMDGLDSVEMRDDLYS